MFDSRIYVRYVNTILGNRDNPDQAIMCTKHHGKEIRELTSRIRKAKQKPTRLDKFFEP